MKSRTSFFNATVFRKDLTRFAPCWMLYGIFLILCLLLMLDSTYWFVRDVADSITLMAVLNLGYAAVVAQLLFGDLYNTRMCNALHALPLARETWFGTHVLSGLLFSLVPNLVLTLIGMAALGQYWYVGIIWFVSVTVQYVCFFGIALFSTMCAGNRFAMLVVYGIVNFFAAIAYWMVDTLYQPLMYGIHWDLEWMSYGMPVYPMTEMNGAVDVLRHYDQRTEMYIIDYVKLNWEPLLYVLPYAVLGLVLAAVALWLYKRRKLEVAGDFIAVKALEPVFLVLYTLCAGVACQLMPGIFLGDTGGYLFLAIGLVLGWFTGLMLLKRTIRVYTKKAFLRLAVLGGAVAVSLVLTWLDPLGVTRWVPEKEDVASITVWDGHYFSDYGNSFTVDSPEDLEVILGIHRTAIADKNGNPEEFRLAVTSIQTLEEPTSLPRSIPANVGSYMDITLQYRLKNGREVCRYYTVFSTYTSGRALQPYFSSPESVLKMDPVDVNAFLKEYPVVYTNETTFEGQDLRQLVEAIILDCREGTMAQPWEYHEHENTAYWLNFQVSMESDIYGDMKYLEIRVYPSNTHTYQWLQSHGALTDQEYYGY